MVSDEKATSNKQDFVLTESVGEAASRKNKQILRYRFFLTAKTAKDAQRSAEGAQLIKFWATLITNKQQSRTKENVTRIIFRQSKCL